MQDQLRAQKQVSQGRAVYCLGIRYDAPGMFFLGHILRERQPPCSATCHPITVAPLTATARSQRPMLAQLLRNSRRWPRQRCLHDRGAALQAGCT